MGLGENSKGVSLVFVNEKPKEVIIGVSWVGASSS